MKKEEFNHILNNSDEEYHFFIFSSPTSIPISLAVHTWIVIVEGSNIQRREILHGKSQCNTSWVHLHLDRFLPWEGLNIIFGLNTFKFNSTLLYHISGNRESVAYKAISFVQKNVKNYKFWNNYLILPGPNSNTFTKWVIDSIDGIDLSLPWNAVGKDYKI